MRREAVVFLQLGQRAHPAVHAVDVKQQAKLVRLNTPPMIQQILNPFDVKYEVFLKDLDHIQVFLRFLVLGKRTTT